MEDLRLGLNFSEVRPSREDINDINPFSCKISSYNLITWCSKETHKRGKISRLLFHDKAQLKMISCWKPLCNASVKFTIPKFEWIGLDLFSDCFFFIFIRKLSEVMSTEMHSRLWLYLLCSDTQSCVGSTTYSSPNCSRRIVCLLLPEHLLSRLQP